MWVALKAHASIWCIPLGVIVGSALNGVGTASHSFDPMRVYQKSYFSPMFLLFRLFFAQFSPIFGTSALFYSVAGRLGRKVRPSKAWKNPHCGTDILRGRP